MITKDNLEKYLYFMGFTKNGNIATSPDNIGITIDFESKKINYPENLVIIGNQTTNFDKKENFVVLDCVIRLLRMGYLASNIILEQKWQLGHGASGGRADIQIKDNNDKSVIIIECKTSGREFISEWNSMKEDGGQLFSYLQQEKDTEFICLYTADFVDDIATNDYYLIKVQDEPNLKLPTDKKGYSSAKKVHDLFNVWKNTYGFDYKTKGFLEPNLKPYQIGKSTINLDNLQEVDSAIVQKKYNEYATILRKHNVSGKENAFDKLVNLFLAKLIDEIQNTEKKEKGQPQDLKFYWKGSSYDNPYDLQDRLQKLYKDGMEKFLEEDVVYIENSQINNAFKLFKKDPDATKKTILDYFHKLKFYSNNDFSFIDVHNEDLFNKNSAILLDTIRMIQDIKLKNDAEQTFLGDLFEGFLNQGIKQSEGQFFTPLPIVKFIISSLPLERMINQANCPLQVIDYACGAGHFLNEYGRQIKNFVKEPKAYYQAITGIEKEYRLSKVAKVSAFMYGQDGIDIIYGDGLTNEFHKNKNKIKKIENETFDLVVANPPYSVDGFLETLSEEDRNKFEIFSSVSNTENCNAIQLFFIERTKQLLKDNGIAALILPDTTLTKNEKIYNEAQKIILKYFDIIAICSMSKGTFWKTKTGTYILFLRKKSSIPSLTEHYKNRINTWFNNDFSKDIIFNDTSLLEDYCHQKSTTLDKYKEFIKKADKVSKEIEKEKLYYYLLARNNPQKILVLQTPIDTKEAKRFLGYFWSDRKGQEGLHYNNEKNNAEKGIDIKGINQIKTPLFDPQNLFDDQNKINSLIRNKFSGHPIIIPSTLLSYVKELNLVDMLDFTKEKFSPNLNLNADVKIDIKSKFKYENLGDLIIENKKSTIQVTEAQNTPNGKYPFFTSGEKILKTDKKLVSDKNLYMSTGGLAYINYYDGDAAYSTDTYSFKTNKDIEIEYIFEIINSIIPQINQLYFKGSGLKHLQKPEFKKIKIPVPNLSTQKNIIKECKEQNDIAKRAQEKINDNNKRILSLINKSISNNKLTTYKLNDRRYFNLFIGKRVEERNTSQTGQYPVYSANVNTLFGEGYTDRNPYEDIQSIKETGFNSDSILWGIDGDWMTGWQDKNNEFYPTDHCGVLRIKDESVINPYFFKFAFDILGKTYKFDRSKRANIEAISSLSIEIPDISIQNDIVKLIKNLEKENALSHQEIIVSEQEKKAIIEKYLN